MPDLRIDETIDYSSLTDDYEAGAASMRAAWSPEGQAFAARLAEGFDFQRRLRELRTALGLSQAEAGKIVGEHQTEISRMERGHVTPSVTRAARIMDTLAAYQAEVASQAATMMAAAGTKARAYSAVTVAQYFLSAQDDEDGMTNLKLQKLLYFAQGSSLAIRGRPLFNDRIKAWKNGPAIPWVWKEYSSFGSEPIDRPAGFDSAALDDDARRLLDAVYQRWGGLAAWKLRDITHESGPWSATPRNEAINSDAMRTYFVQLLAQS